MIDSEIREIIAQVAADLERRIRRNFEIMPTVTLDQAATALGVSNETMRKLCLQGRIPHIKLDHLYRIRPVDINEYLEAHSRGGTLR